MDGLDPAHFVPSFVAKLEAEAAVYEGVMPEDPALQRLLNFPTRCALQLGK